MEEQLSPGTKVEHKMKLFLSLEGVMELHNEGVVNVTQHAALSLRVLDLVPGDDKVLVEYLHGV